MGDAPGLYADHSELTIRLSNRVRAKLNTYRRQDQPGMTEEEVVAYLVEDSLVRLGLWEEGGDEGR